ncbi:MAG TPA: PIN domain-containing protein [Spirochaetota bacterium]|nr:PIN domain-containing protein [Spirochaetota bacterium]HPI90914.1 PIN domain-containing protein [Spirochaetota bacterium]HPR48386.1 PIN domain-containing protein [Spirochaetota bacterium]
MKYLLDTVIVIRHFAATGKIGIKAKEILENTDNGVDTFYISAISLMEILYLSEKNRIPVDLEKAITEINTSSFYTIIPLNTEIIIKAQEITNFELHDRMILATAAFKKPLNQESLK